MVSPLDEAMQDFRSGWRGNICGMSDIRYFLNSCDLSGTNDRLISHAVKRAGMLPTRVRVRESSAVLDSVIIVQSSDTLTPDYIKSISRDVVLTKIHEFRKSTGWRS